MLYTEYQRQKWFLSPPNQSLLASGQTLVKWRRRKQSEPKIANRRCMKAFLHSWSEDIPLKLTWRIWKPPLNNRVLVVCQPTTSIPTSSVSATPSQPARVTQHDRLHPRHSTYIGRATLAHFRRGSSIVLSYNLFVFSHKQQEISGKTHNCNSGMTWKWE